MKITLKLSERRYKLLKCKFILLQSDVIHLQGNPYSHIYFVLAFILPYVNLLLREEQYVHTLISFLQGVVWGGGSENKIPVMKGEELLKSLTSPYIVQHDCRMQGYSPPPPLSQQDHKNDFQQCGKHRPLANAIQKYSSQATVHALEHNILNFQYRRCIRDKNINDSSEIMGFKASIANIGQQ